MYSPKIFFVALLKSISMTSDNDNFKLIAAVALGAIAGLLLGGFLWGGKREGEPFSKHVSTLGNILKQLEDIKSEEADNLKERINNILSTIESNYVSNKE